MSLLQRMFSSLSILEWRSDDDFVDRLSYFYTSSFLIVMGILVSFKLFGGRPLECWVPAHYTGQWEEYAEMYCWSMNTYWVPFSHQIPPEGQTRKSQEISYYQWVPFFLVIQAFLFYTPCVIWRLLNTQSGIRLHAIIAVAQDPKNVDPMKRYETMEVLSRHIDRILKYQQMAHKGKRLALHKYLTFLNIRYFDYYLTALYLMTKFLYFANVVANLFVMNKVLETSEYSFYGFGVLGDLMKGNPWESSGHFPRVTLCDFDVRTLGNVQRETVQCVLVINIFNEKIFILCWIWFSFLALATFISFCYWMSASVRRNDRLGFVARHLEFSGVSVNEEDRSVHRLMEEFTSHFLRVDGVFILRMVAAHAGVIFCSELTNSIWKIYLEERMDIEKTHAIPEFRESWSSDFPPPPPPLKTSTVVIRSQNKNSSGTSVRLSIEK